VVQKLIRKLFPWAGGIMLVTQALYLIIVPNRDPVLIVAGCSVGLFLLYCGFGLRLSFRKSYRNDRRFKDEFTANISTEDVHIVTPFADSHMKWSTFVRFLESDSVFMVFIAQWNFLVLPKRSFTAEQADEFRRLLQQNVHS
jgi:hypothetical protein